MKRGLALILPCVISACRGTSAAPDAGSHEETAIAIVPARAIDAGVAPPPRALHARSPAKGGERIEIASHAFRAGSVPGDPGRDPVTEPAAYDATLGAFVIDALPYPNDPMQPTMTGVTPSSAERLCAARAARLCTELEWERACKGADDDAYATGASWDPACDRDPSSCRSSLGVRALGATREWTASLFASSGAGAGAPVLRGGGGHRCAERTRATDEKKPGDAAFRCCSGGPNDAAMPAIADHPLTPFRPMAIDAAALARIFAGVPELARIGAEVRYFSEADVLKRSDAGAGRAGVTLSPTPVLWSPSPGAELLVAAGRGATSSFVVALWRVDEDAYRLAASLFLDGDAPPVVLAYDAQKRGALLWTSAPGRRGEEGEIALRADHRVAITQR